jgi:hypothetical protein
MADNTTTVQLLLQKLGDRDKATLRDIIDEQVEHMFGRDDEGKLPRYTIHLKVTETPR